MSDDTDFDSIRTMAENGNVESQYTLGTMYEFGIGVEKNIEEAKHWLQEAAEKGNHIMAQYHLGHIDSYLPRNPHEVVYAKTLKGKWLYEGPHQFLTFDPNSLLCELKKEGLNNNLSDFDKERAKILEMCCELWSAENEFARKWSKYYWSQAAEQGDSDAMFNLGTYYLDVENRAEAVKWYKQASERGVVLASQILFGLCENEQDYWRKKAAEQGHPEALLVIGRYAQTKEEERKCYEQWESMYGTDAEEYGWDCLIRYFYENLDEQREKECFCSGNPYNNIVKPRWYEEDIEFFYFH